MVLFVFLIFEATNKEMPYHTIAKRTERMKITKNSGIPEAIFTLKVKLSNIIIATGQLL